MPSGTVFVFTSASAYSQGLGFQVTRSGGAKYNGSNQDRLYLAIFDVFGVPYDSYSVGADWLANVSSQECAIWVCVKTFDVITSNGHQTQIVLDTFSDINLTTLDEVNGGDNYTFLPLPANMSGSPNTNYTFGVFAASALVEYLGPLFNGTVFRNLHSNSPSSDAIEALWNGTSDMSMWMSNLALSMTNVMLSTTPADRAVYDGSAFQLSVHVRWPWIALPVSMVLGSLIFLVIIIVETARSPVEAWKGSPLTYLVFGVDQETKGTLEAQAAVNGYRNLANNVGRTKATLKHLPSGKWTFQSAS